MADQIVIHFVDKTKPPVTVDRNTVDRSTSFNIVGLFSRDHTENINQALFDLLEHFASPNPPTSPVEGQLWFDLTSQRLKVAVDSGSIVWTDVHEIYSSETTPPSSITSLLWYDTSIPQLKVYNGTGYESVADNYVSLSGDVITGPVTFETILDVDGNVTSNGAVTVIDSFWIQGNSTNATGSYYGSGNNVLTLDDGSQLSVTTDGSFSLNAFTNITFKSGSDVFDVASTGRVFQVTNLDIRSYVNLSASNNRVLNVRNSPTVPTSLVPYSEIPSLSSSLTDFVEVAGGTVAGTLYVKKSTDFTPLSFQTLEFFNTFYTERSVRLTNTGSTLTLQHIDSATDMLSFDLTAGELDVHNNKVTTSTPVQDSDLSTKGYSDQTLTAAVDDVTYSLRGQAAAWASISLSLGTLLNGYNINSITLLGDGQLRANFDTPMDDSNYVAIVTTHNTIPTAIRDQRYNNFVVEQTTTYATIVRTVQGTTRVLYDIGDGDDEYYIYRYHGRSVLTTSGDEIITVVFYQ